MCHYFLCVPYLFICGRTCLCAILVYVPYLFICAMLVYMNDICLCAIFMPRHTDLKLLSHLSSSYTALLFSIKKQGSFETSWTASSMTQCHILVAISPYLVTYERLTVTQLAKQIICPLYSIL
jgi:hypothetical protein